MFRLAPTPSGFLHIGNAFSFLLTEKLANGNEILLRIDDIDAERKRPEYVRDIFESLEWLNIKWQAGPKNEIDFERHWSQQHRLPLYQNAIEKLVSTGEVYACSCSRKQLAENGICTCENKKIPLNAPDVSLRLKIPVDTSVSFRNNWKNETVDLSHIGSVIIRRRDEVPAYQLVSVVDDMHFGVTDIVRGEDLFQSTAQQVFIAQRLGLEKFEKINFTHHPLITDANGEKLSKSAGADSLKAMREKNISSDTIMPAFLAWFMGLQSKIEQEPNA